MAKILVSNSVTPTKIEKFLGLNVTDIGDSQIQIGESGNMTNFYITNDYKLRKIYGYKSFYDFETPIRGMYSTTLNGIRYLLIATGGKLYYYLKEELDNEENWDNLTPHEIGVIPDNETSFFTFDNKVYILCGQYMKWDGTNLGIVEGYAPLVFINTPPAGGGVIYEELNILSSKKHQTFNGNGSATSFQLAQQNIASVDKVIVNGVETSAYTVNLVEGKVNFNTAPTTAMDNVDIYWTKNDSSRNIIDGMKFGTVFGGDVDTRVFLYGNSSCKNRTYFSGLADGIPSVEYFPASSQVDIGPANFTLTDLTRQYDRLIATTNRPEAYYMTISTESLSVLLSDSSTTTRLVPSVATFPLNEVHGNVAPGQGQLINNYPVTIDNSAIIQWKATNVRDEKNMERISEKIRPELSSMSLNLIKTLDFESENQLWLGESNKIYIYNYNNRTYSKIIIPDTLAHMEDLDNHVYMGTYEGKVVKWSKNFKDFDGEIINSHWEMSFSDFNVPHLRKTMNRLWVLLQPQDNSSATISYISNRNQSITSKTIKYKNQQNFFSEMDFSNFSFQISQTLQPFRLKMKAKKFTNMKIVIDNAERTDCTILGLILRIESFGESK